MIKTSYYRKKRQRNREGNREWNENSYRSEQDRGREWSESRNRGPANGPNYGRSIREEDDNSGDYGYNQGRNSYSNPGGRSYGQSYGQYQQDSYERGYSDQRNYAGRYDDHRQPYGRQDNETRNYFWEAPERDYDMNANAYGYDRDQRGQSWRGSESHGRSGSQYGNRYDRDENNRRPSVYPLRQTHMDEYDNRRSGGYHEPGYRHEGYENSGQREGFGHRSDRRHDGDWERADDYRGGHAQRHRGRGRYGSR